jgi:hypothetical protein
VNDSKPNPLKNNQTAAGTGTEEAALKTRQQDRTLNYPESPVLCNILIMLTIDSKTGQTAVFPFLLAHIQCAHSLLLYYFFKLIIYAVCPVLLSRTQ